MNEMTPRSQPEPSQPEPGTPALSGQVRRQLQQLFPDLDPDTVAQVLGFTDLTERRQS